MLPVSREGVKYMIFDTINPIISTFARSTSLFLPSFLGGLLILAIGLVLSQIVRKLLISFFDFFKIGVLISKTKFARPGEVKIWEEIIIELVSWATVILFLIPAAEVWGLSQVTVVLRQLLFYIPNVLVAVVIGFVGIIFANLASDIVRQSVRTMGAKSSNALSTLARYAIIFFTILIVLNQLGIAQDLVRILFTGIVAMLAIAGGLAFGMGGKDLAKDILEDLRRKV
ncbi:hypothetical protein A3D80_04425 [Candidatus Roizmanbacteria bacterium RIFCSPHIGHO2_02_FULL_40_13b]|uniref:Small-conductance mechanosensitive ion channel n=1 Tax=Candidatus Roizmanbacteria bacterium RIFCSPHIGHO2_01_FULL_39_24 TaxID=1802032 RepID=A0A1F7GFL0_9BACT|nr:MAG: hypothetical protein A2799_04435 [Candidatus Roizmanbacteria bacterium RIFCSPHIGHO2_01_FULL_39_24]OGK26412.1 MAG: hypothetical protein A3D80_04425 [Candidatus Roizmanbacteria bacterium RIFCSPHIGHO2_02_FULL_40_13b]OGK49024.1 MAG: hypothetical protein A3A56_03265 [Candidatus Roizmanbacteria bacterium RIFCSPLOWO2_01_FULL_40_32]OGK56723.1 MAG: hypothetical protein A3H83_01810 [Candidatus Roizmanbacteria bacterium RIFCSPLOWO2_02_FULL_39_8]